MHFQKDCISLNQELCSIPDSLPPLRSSTQAEYREGPSHFHYHLLGDGIDGLSLGFRSTLANDCGNPLCTVLVDEWLDCDIGAAVLMVVAATVC